MWECEDKDVCLPTYFTYDLEIAMDFILFIQYAGTIIGILSNENTVKENNI